MNKVNGKIESLQGLRAILIFLIFVVHTSMIGNISSNNVIYKYLASGGGRKELLSFSFCQALLRLFISET